MGIRNNERYQIEATPAAHPDAIVERGHARFTVLTEQMIRIEYNPNNRFEDRATQTVLNRDFEVPEFEVVETEKELHISTKHVQLFYYKEAEEEEGLKPNDLHIEVNGAYTLYHSNWNYGEETDDLRGTARTLDETDGAVPLERGLMSTKGFSIIEDSYTAVIREDGWVEQREDDVIDFYFLGHGRDYLTCLKDFYHLCGKTPLLPRYTLGNWWSRYYPYSDEEYKTLMNQFKEKDIPFSVAVIDMDWHLTDIDPKYGSGWTGYTWNKELFPDPEAFLAWLHEQGLHTTLNVHPANGVKPHEDVYEEMGKALDIDIEKEEDIKFDVTNEDFLEAYFTYLHHPHEDIGVDFWWVDWQSGDISKIEGLDPLWMLNHYHFLDSKRNGRRPLIFSRYAGIGSHRYPIGFSGDTRMTWETLQYQPYFTANASNVGYGWWSHDIGGHTGGYKNDEMHVRWVQFGVFSPIMRLHDGDSEFHGKEPWRYNRKAEEILEAYLRLRHQLVPYLYTMNYRNHLEGLPLVQPMYYHDSEEENAYNAPNQYYFGSELIVAPITTKLDAVTHKGHVSVWLPEGLWFDFFTGKVYDGNRKINMYRDLSGIPVLAKAGGIIPLSRDIENAVDNPTHMEIRVFAGDNGKFTLHEDDGVSHDENHQDLVTTELELKWNEEKESASFIIKKPEGDTKVLPKKRSYHIHFMGFESNPFVTVYRGEEEKVMTCVLKEKGFVIDIPEIEVGTEIRVEIPKAAIKVPDYQKEVFDFIDEAQMSFDKKDKLYELIKKSDNHAKVIGSLQTLNLEQEVLEIISEILWAY
ncbi:DUF5110 domain-containing protein [Desemzia sp. RIT804]|uniref:glycoside hydrolase family 31 protein n=1 Tax=Desemzia sp. RIT 804 TaxID=2810209 RepID=UPI00194EC940|nr:glycoside hydrolase family 31 protein [Desemzia sp. RIT 804]MBM6615427.1 DUF5110 domain-containing protein [Desemzia sp. RIT 804]